MENLHKYILCPRALKTNLHNAQKSFPTEKKLTEAVDIGAIQQSLVRHFQGIKDPRVERTKKHQLLVFGVRLLHHSFTRNWQNNTREP